MIPFYLFIKSKNTNFDSTLRLFHNVFNGNTCYRHCWLTVTFNVLAAVGQPAATAMRRKLCSENRKLGTDIGNV